jgi:hypothetical protein
MPTPAAAPAPAPRRFRRTIVLVVVAFLVAIATPIITITSSASDVVTMGGRLLSPWSASVAAVASQAPAGDPAVSQEQAAEALRRILGPGTSGQNITLIAATQVEVPSVDSVPAGLFPEARDSAGRQIDWPDILLSARRRLSPAERAYLAGVAASPLWKEWDLLARSPSLDILSARVELPFREHATATELPLMRLTTLTNAARLTAARAAHFAAMGRRDSAEAAVHATLAVGLLLDREATNLIEAFVARRLVYAAATISNRMRGDTTTLEVVRFSTDSTERTAAEARAVLVALATDSTAHRAARFEALMNLGIVPCTNTRELLFGFRRDVADAFASARRNLVRHPSDSALLDLLEFAAERSPDLHEAGVWPAMFRGMAHLSSAVLFNKRIHGCAAMLPYLRMQ